MWKQFKTGQVINMDNVKAFTIKRNMPVFLLAIVGKPMEEECYLKMLSDDKKAYGVMCSLGGQGGEVLLDVFVTSEEAQAYIGDLLKEMGASLQ